MGSEISIWVSLLFRLRHKVLKMGQGGQTISDTLLWCIQKWLSSCDPLRASKPCVVLGLRKGNSLSMQDDAFQRHFQRTKGSVTLGHLGTSDRAIWDSNKSWRNLFGTGSKGIPSQDTDLGKDIGWAVYSKLPKFGSLLPNFCLKEQPGLSEGSNSGEKDRGSFGRLTYLK